MNCEKAEREIHAWLDGQLKGKEREEIEGHLRECSLCRAEMQRVRAVGELVGRLPQPVPSRDLDRRVMASFLASRPSGDFRALAATQAGGFRISRALAASVAGLAVLFGISTFYLGWTLGRHHSQPSNSAVIEQTNRSAVQPLRSGEIVPDVRSGQKPTELREEAPQSGNTVSLAGFRPIREPRIRILGRQEQ